MTKSTWRRGHEAPRPDAVGILALDVYFPTQKVTAADLETADGCPGKYTVGLGQEAMAFTSDREDAVSLALTVAHSLMDKYGVRPHEIGHVQVATESGVDRSKSIMSHLMTLFQPPHNTTPPPSEAHGAPEAREAQAPHAAPSVAAPAGRRPASPWRPPEGSDCVHACYGGTSALLAAVAWVESRRWDGRLALVVATDVALYPPGSAARPTGGCGAAALLVGPHAPLVLDPAWYGAHAEHSWDFYKPLGRLPYPELDGRATLEQYLTAAGQCAVRLAERLEETGEVAPGEGLLPRVDHFAAHSPFSRLARKALARVALMDRLRAATEALRVAAAATGDAAAAGPAAEAAAAAREEAVLGRAAGPAVVVGCAGEEAGAGRHAAEDTGGKRAAPPVAAAPAGPLEAEGPASLAAGGDDGCGGGTGHGGGRLAQQGGEWAAEWVREQRTGSGGFNGHGPIRAGKNEPESTPTPPPPPPAGHPTPGSPPPAAGADTNGSCTSFLTAAIAPTVQVGRGAGGDTSTSAETITATSPRPDPDPGQSHPQSVLHPDPDPDVDLGLGPGVRPPACAEAYGSWALEDRALESRLMRETEGLYRDKGSDAAWLPKQLGNSYTACLFTALASLVWRQGANLHGRRLLLYSFGSGTLAAMYSIIGAHLPPSPPPGCHDAAGASSCTAETTGNAAGTAVFPAPAPSSETARATAAAAAAASSPAPPSAAGGTNGCTDGGMDPRVVGRFSLEAMQRALDLDRRLGSRVGRPVSHFNDVTSVAAAAYSCPAPYEPRGDLADVAAGTYYLVRVDEQGRRLYERKAA